MMFTNLKKYLRNKNKPEYTINSKNSEVVISQNSKIRNTTINLTRSKIVIEDNVNISNYNITLIDAELVIKNNCVLESASSYNTPVIHINHGALYIDQFVRLRNSFSIRFGGNVTIGQYTNINENSLVRCDESIKIGKYCMISYECLIFDTNTHNILPVEERRAMTRKDYPFIGMEYKKPVTSPVIIGDDCWIGHRAVILKGVSLGTETIVGVGTTVTKEVLDSGLVVSAPARNIYRS
jgi:acetyltransferase-like isoleucine patch superfamily enzyme